MLAPFCVEMQYTKDRVINGKSQKENTFEMRCARSDYGCQHHCKIENMMGADGRCRVGVTFVLLILGWGRNGTFRRPPFRGRDFSAIRHFGDRTFRRQKIRTFRRQRFLT